MLAAAHYAVHCQARKKAATIFDRAVGRCGGRARPYNAGRWRQRKIKYRRQGCIEPEHLYRARYKFTLFAYQCIFTRPLCREPYCLRRRHGRKCVAQPVHSAAFHIDAAKTLSRA
jgi:hypothetical protein